MKINIRLSDEACMPEITQKGDWIDLKAAREVTINGPISHTLNSKRTQRDVEFSSALIPLGIAMSLPKGFEAVVLPRSSTYRRYGILLGNCQGVIDNSYNGDNDLWFFNAVACRPTTIAKGDRICQFRIQLSQKATIWQKIRWLFWNGKITFNVTDILNPESRGSSLTDNTTNN